MNTGFFIIYTKNKKILIIVSPNAKILVLFTGSQRNITERSIGTMREYDSILYERLSGQRRYIFGRKYKNCGINTMAE
jgi:hypothetical protein